MYNLSSIPWNNFHIQEMTREHYPSNVVWINTDDPSAAWKKAIKAVYEIPSTIAIWDSFPVIEDSDLENAVLTQLHEENFISMSKMNTQALGPERFSYLRLPAKDQATYFSRYFERVAKNRGLDPKKHPGVSVWKMKIVDILNGLGEAFPNTTCTAHLSVGEGFGTTQHEFRMHVDGAANDKELNVAWSQFGLTTLFVNEADIKREIKRGEIKVKFTQDDPVLWSVPKGAFALCGCNNRSAIHGSPVELQGQGSRAQTRAFFRMRLLPNILC